MKNILITIILLVGFIGSSQTWKFKSGGNAFDGKYRVAYVNGKGNDWPYHKPMLAINVYNDESMNFYITGYGYYPDEEDIDVLWIFENEPDILYKTDITLSNDKETLFFNSFSDINGNKFITRMEFIEKLKASSKVDVRVKDDRNKNDIAFSLIGSTKAIDYAISAKYRNKLKEINDYIQSSIDSIIAVNKELAVKKEQLFKRLKPKIKLAYYDYKVNDDEMRKLWEVIDEGSNTYNYDLFKIDSLNFVMKSDTSFDNYVELFDNENFGLQRVPLYNVHSEEFLKYMNKKVVEDKKRKQLLINQHADELLIKYGTLYNLDNDEIELILNEAKRGVNYFSRQLKILEVDSISVSFEKYRSYRIVETVVFYDEEGFQLGKIYSTAINEHNDDISRKEDKRIGAIQSKIQSLLLKTYDVTSITVYDIEYQIEDEEYSEINIDDIKNVKFRYEKDMKQFSFFDFYHSDGSKIFSLQKNDKDLTKKLKRKMKN